MPSDALLLEVDLKEVNQKLAGLPYNLESKGARKATRAAAKIVLEDARALAPVDTGELERSLKVRARKRSRRNKGTVGHAVVTGEDFFKGDQFYGAFIELGTQYITADPFIRPALWSNTTRVMQEYVNVLREWLRTDAVKKAV